MSIEEKLKELSKYAEMHITQLIASAILSFICGFILQKSITDPCIAHAIIMETYNIENKDAIYWEPHHDGKESKVITLIFVDREDTSNWTGGELDVYTSLNAFDYPDNKIRIEPIPGRVVVFDSSQVHCIRPYFGTDPRKSISIGWE